ncbi:MAG TPA: biopolymer transporter ExbD [Tepidisphaeraceae bacterium]|jgi:biopolymer transport protein ExbD|nr:biopolymer transporter ExbD [Tepidisphaeraceae bacterium]
MKIARRPMPAPHIPFISLADIAWQIIIFFLVASAFTANEALKVDVPNTSDKAPTQTQTDNAITIIASEKALTVDDKPVAFERLADVLAERLKGKKSDQERAVVVLGKDDLSFQRDVDIMFAVQKAGGVLVMAEEQ